MEIRYRKIGDYSPIQDNGELIDLASREHIEFTMGDLVRVPLGIAIDLPEGYYARLYARSSTPRNKGLIIAGTGIIENSYCGDGDELMFEGYAIESGMIQPGQYIAQLEICKKQPDITLIKVDHLNNPNRGGFGTTGD